MFTQPFHVFRNHNASLSEGGALPVVVQGFSETPHGTRGATDFPHPMRQSVARLPLACAPSPGATARRTRGVLVEGATPLFWALVRHRGGRAGAPLWSHHLPSPLGGRSLHSDPCGKAVESARKPIAKNSRPQMASGRERQVWGIHTTPYLRSAARAACHST